MATDDTAGVKVCRWQPLTQLCPLDELFTPHWSCWKRLYRLMRLLDATADCDCSRLMRLLTRLSEFGLPMRLLTRCKLPMRLLMRVLKAVATADPAK